MKIYLAARYSRYPEMKEVRAALAAAGHVVTSQWIDNHAGKLEKSFTPERLTEEPDFCATFALTDVTDLHDAEAVVSFTGNGGGGKGGRHVEFGMGYALGKRCIVVGPRENVFHCLPGVEIVAGVDELVERLRQDGTSSPSTTSSTQS